MSNFFTFEEISARRVPIRDSYPILCTRIQEIVGKEPAIRNAIFYGSVLQAFTCRSNVNIFLQHLDDHGVAAREMMDKLIEEAKVYNIPLAFAHCDISSVGKYSNPFGPLMVQHFRRSVEQEGTMKGHLPVFRPSVSATHEMKSYLLVKEVVLKKYLAEMSTLREVEVTRALQKAFESPVHIARGMLGLGKIYLPDDSKQVVMQKYKEEFPLFWKQLEHLMHVDGQYSIALNIQLANPNESEYRDLLGYMIDHISLVLEFLYTNLGHITRRS